MGNASADAVAARLAAGQLSLLTRAQGRGAGLTHRQMDHRVVAGRWEVFRRSVYGMAGVPDSFDRRVMAACLAAGPGAVASHHTAAVLWKLWGVAGDQIEISTHVSQAPRLHGVTTHRVRRLEASDLTTYGPIPVTTPERTLVDLSGLLHPVLLRKAVDDAQHRGLLTFPSLRQCCEALQGRGRRRLSELRVLLEERLVLGERTQSPLERRVLGLLRAAGVREPECQFQVVLGGRVFVLDYAYWPEMVALEVDGWSAHSSRGAFDADRARANELTLGGWLLLRFTSRSSDRAIVTSVQAALERRCAENTHA